MNISNFLKFIALFLFAIGTINGIGYSCWIGEYVTAISVAVVAAMAVPTVRKFVKDIMNE